MTDIDELGKDLLLVSSWDAVGLCPSRLYDKHAPTTWRGRLYSFLWILFPAGGFDSAVTS